WILLLLWERARNGGDPSPVKSCPMLQRSGSSTAALQVFAARIHSYQHSTAPSDKQPSLSIHASRRHIRSCAFIVKTRPSRGDRMTASIEFRKQLEGY